jgi:hypothetical protein
MGGRPPLEDHEIWEEWDKTKPTEDAKAAFEEFVSRLHKAQGQRGTAQVSGKDVEDIFKAVATEGGFTPPDCGTFWDVRVVRWADDARRNDLIDLCRAYARAAREPGNENLGTSIDAHETAFRAVATVWLNQRIHQSQTKDFVDVLLAKPAAKRGETFASDLEAFLDKSGGGRKTRLCGELQKHLEALYKQSKGQPAGE